MAEWRSDMENAPADGHTPVLALISIPGGYMYAVVQIVHWEGGDSGWCQPCAGRGGGFLTCKQPTHWLPLPPPPKAKESGDA